MNGADIGNLLFGFVTGAIPITLITLLFNRRKVNAEALHSRAQGEGVAVGAQSAIIGDLRQHNTDLQGQINDLRKDFEGLVRTERTNSLIMLNLTLWTHKAYDVMTDEQRKRVGPPPVESEHHIGGSL